MIFTNATFVFAEDGFGNKATGGAGGASVSVNTMSDLASYASSPSPFVITVSGTITLGDNVMITSNKTIQGADSNATVNGDLYIGSTARNIIVQNLNITNPSGVGDGDGITILGGRNILVTHCTFTDCADGECDITVQADSVTISWCRFRYVSQSSHNYVNLIGSSDSYMSDLGNLHVTIHHCWYDQNCLERMPSVRYGRAHVYNNYYNAAGNNYCVRTRLYAECLVEYNYFENVKNPWELLTTTGTSGRLVAANNNVSFMESSNGVTWVSGWYPGQSLIPGADSVFTPPYSYTFDTGENVKTRVMASAGNNGNVTGLTESPTTVFSFALHQNYPNPFNPSTTIRFSVPPSAERDDQVRESSHVWLVVYDILGREVATLVNEELKAGSHERIFNAEGLAGGVYLYRLSAGSFAETRKLALLK
jgi:pectate lyase